ncbi:ralBP1-associated Eps domain-containing protein 2 isoform X2 [Clinocottus analis]|uniref:ralBP1-associated Eps domain-containing protein 2 isoform X2 n=1 Tax=Clinocottus analis TaxID=304258 RepID=UPI0035C0E768
MRQPPSTSSTSTTSTMEQDSGAAARAGSFISLNEHEQRYYAGLHSLCQADASGTLSAGKVAELLAASQLPPEALRRVTELCGAKRLGYFGTPQFFVALKLLAAAQSALPIHLESTTANLPLPRFSGLKNEPEMRYAVVLPSAAGQAAPSRTGSGSSSWTPAERRHPEDHVDRKEPRSPPRSPCSSPPRSPPACRGYPYAKRRNGADALTAYEGRSTVPPEQHSSPGGYGTRAAAARTSSLERLDQQGLGDYPDEDPWRITEEQLEYYTNQFKSLQPDLGALILGTIAKNFFTKSKLPIPELSHIWELSDVDRDGALTFSEFCTAFHLIVARKNGYPLPERLPGTLRTGLLQPEDPDSPDTPESVEPLIVFEDAEPRPSHTNRSVIERLEPALTSTTQDVKKDLSKQDVGVKTQDKRSLHLGAFSERPDPSQDLDPHMKTRTRPRSYSSTSIEDAMKKAEEPPTPPPRPQKTHSRASSLDLNKLFQQGAPGVKSGWLPHPPALPPRPSTSQVAHFISVPEKTPPKKVQQPNFADFSHFREEEERSVKPEDRGPRSRFGRSSEDLAAADVVPVCQAPQKPVRRKYHAEGQNPEATPPPAGPFPAHTKPAQKPPSKQKREIQTAIRKNKEANAVLTRLNSELQQQLKVAHQERVTLETQLELQRPLAST